MSKRIPARASPGRDFCILRLVLLMLWATLTIPAALARTPGMLWTPSPSEDMRPDEVRPEEMPSDEMRLQETSPEETRSEETGEPPPALSPDIQSGKAVASRGIHSTAFEPSSTALWAAPAFDGTPGARPPKLLAPRRVSPLTGRRADFWFTPVPAKNVAFMGLATTGRDTYASIGLKRALGGTLDQPGYRVIASIGSKLREVAPGTGASSHQLHAIRLLAGHEWHEAGMAISLHAGASFVAYSAKGQAQSHHAGRFGPTLMVDLWKDWGKPASTFAARYTALTAILDQAGRSAFLRLRHGFQYADWPLRFGPEASVSNGNTLRRQGVRVQDGWRHARLGVAVTEVPFFEAKLALTGGAEWRAHRKTGAYAELSAYIRY